MLRLWTEKVSGADARIPVRWCLDKQTTEQLKALGRTVWIVLVVVKNGKEKCRKVLPIDAMMEYVTFDSPGTHSIQAIVVAERSNEEKVRKEIVWKNNWGNYGERIVTEQGELNLGRIDSVIPNQLYGTCAMEVDVAEEFFAPDPPKWLLQWATAIWDTPLCDQCDFRRRVMFSFTVQPILIGLITIVAYVCIFVTLAIALLFGRRNISWKNVLLFHKDSEENFGHRLKCIYGHGSVFCSNKKGEPYALPIFWMFTPIFPVCIFCLLYVVKYFFSTDITLLGILGVTLRIIFTMFLSTLLTLVGIGALAWIIEMQKRSPKAIKEEKPKKEIPKPVPVVTMDFDAIVCDGKPGFTLKDLPKRHRTFHLYYEGFKTKVCKPFAR